MTQPLEYWSMISLHGIDEPRIFRSDLFQCIMNTAMFEQAGYNVTIGKFYHTLYQSLYQSNSNSKIFVRTLNSDMTDAHIRPFFSVGEAWEYFRYLNNRRLHFSGYWELLDSNHWWQGNESIINIVFIWRNLKTEEEEEVNWMKEGF